MRPAPELVTQPAPPRSPPATCDMSTCQWRLPSSSDLQANAATILIVLLCGLICGLILNTAIRCCLWSGHGRSRSAAPRQQHHQQEQQEQQEQQQLEPKLDDSDLIAAPAMTFVPGVTRLAGTEAECSICLTEFVEGDRIRVLVTCSHGFHVECIERWLHSQKSCPTCRSSLVIDRPGSSESEGIDHCHENAGRRTDPAGESSPGGERV